MVSAISKAASLMGSVRSKKKAAAARRNGRKGGRPKKVVDKQPNAG